MVKISLKYVISSLTGLICAILWFVTIFHWWNHLPLIPLELIFSCVIGILIFTFMFVLGKWLGIK